MPGTSHPRTAHSEIELGDQELSAKTLSGSGYPESAGPAPAPAPTVISLDGAASGGD